MMNGVPCVASSLPGVRQPVMIHKMGKVFPIGDANALADSILEVLDQKAAFTIPQVDFSMYNPEKVAKEYEQLFEQIKEELR
jgi:glycosyltransferase involved in cell wall biosynthesis